MQLARVSLVIGLVLSASVGVGHFFVPFLLKWYSYIPNCPRWLQVAINWTNFFLSLFLTGVSILLLVFAPQVLNRETVALAFYGLLVFVWFAKIIVALVHNWGHDLSWKIQLTCYAVLLAFLALPLALLL